MRLRKTAVTGAACAALTLGGAAGAAPALADYGPGNIYQGEISSNLSGPQGGGAWLWLAPSPNPGTSSTGTGDYARSDFGHRFRAASDQGEGTRTKGSRT